MIGIPFYDRERERSKISPGNLVRAHPKLKVQPPNPCFGEKISDIGDYVKIRWTLRQTAPTGKAEMGNYFLTVMRVLSESGAGRD